MIIPTIILSSSLFTFGGVDYSWFFYAIAGIGVATYLFIAYFRGDFNKFFPKQSKADAQLDEESHPNRIELFAEIPDIKFYDTDNEETYDYNGADILFQGQNTLDLSVNLLKDGVEQEPIKCNDSQLLWVMNRSSLGRRQFTLRYSSRGSNGILSKENNELKKENSNLLIEVQTYRDRYENKLQDIDQQIAREQESKGRHRRSPSPKGESRFKKPVHEQDDFDSDSSDEDLGD